jgi:hypothetical protein
VSSTDPRVDAWIAALPDWQAVICLRLRELIHEADPEIEETIKRTTLPYFVLHGTVCAFQSTKRYVNLFLYDGGIVPDPEGIVTGGHGNETGRQISIHDVAEMNDRALVAYIRQIVADNRAGGWRKLKRERLGAKG